MQALGLLLQLTLSYSLQALGLSLQFTLSYSLQALGLSLQFTLSYSLQALGLSLQLTLSYSLQALGSLLQFQECNLVVLGDRENEDKALDLIVKVRAEVASLAARCQVMIHYIYNIILW